MISAKVSDIITWKTSQNSKYSSFTLYLIFSSTKFGKVIKKHLEMGAIFGTPYLQLSVSNPLADVEVTLRAQKKSK